MRFMHFSDLHLDSPFVGMQKRYPGLQETIIQAPYRAFHRGVSHAIREEVDAVLIVGDIYDSQQQTIYAQHAFLKELERLESADIPVIICHGNHDYLNNERLLVQYPDNVFVFTSETVDSIDLQLADRSSCRIYGFSYLNRWIKVSKVSEFPKNPHQTDYTVGLYHGEKEGSGQAGNYAPFSLQEMIQKDYDYWALGHIHQQQVLNQAPLIQYAGSSQGRNRLEIGSKGAFLVTLEKGKPARSEFIELSSLEWRMETIDCQVGWQVNELIWAIQSLLKHYQAEVDNGMSSKLISLTLSNAQRLSVDLQQQIEAGELDQLLDEPASNQNFAVIVAIQLQRQMLLEAFEYDETLKNSFKEACLQLENGDLYQEVLVELFDHPLIKQYLADLATDPDLRKSLVRTAKELMIQTIGFDFKEGLAGEN